MFNVWLVSLNTYWIEGRTASGGGRAMRKICSPSGDTAFSSWGCGDYRSSKQEALGRNDFTQISCCGHAESVGIFEIPSWIHVSLPPHIPLSQEVFFFNVFVYLFGCAEYSLRHLGSSVMAYRIFSCCVGSSFLSRDWTRAFCIGNVES